MEASTRVRGENWQPVEQARLERKIGEMFSRLGDFSQARAHLSRSLALLGEALPAPGWKTRPATAGEFLTQLGHRLVPYRLPHPMGASFDQAAEEIFLVYTDMTWIETVVDLERVLLISIRSLNACERRGYPYGSALAASTLAIALDMFGQARVAERYYRLALSYSRQVIPHRPASILELNRAIHHNLHGNTEKSLEHGFRTAEIAHSTGDLRAWGNAMQLVTWAQSFLGMLNQAAKTSQEMIVVAEEGSDRQVLCWGLFCLGFTQNRLGQMDSAITNLERAIAIAGVLPDYYTHMCAGAWLSHCYLARGELDQALSNNKTIEEVYRVYSIPFVTPYLGNARSEAYLAAAEGSTGTARRAWLKKARQSCQETVKAARINRPTLPTALMFQGRYEWLRGNPESAQQWWRKALEEARRAGDPYQEGMIHLEAGRRLGEREHLLRAESILDEIGAEFDLAAARNALEALKVP
jgi:tetratricopeptide (TPR) repeat protein